MNSLAQPQGSEIPISKLSGGPTTTIGKFPVTADFIAVVYLGIYLKIYVKWTKQYDSYMIQRRICDLTYI